MNGREATEEILRTLELVVDYLYCQDRAQAMQAGEDRYNRAEPSALTKRVSEAKDLALQLTRTMSAASLEVGHGRSPFQREVVREVAREVST